MNLCTHIFNYSELMSTTVSQPLMEQKRLNNLENDENVIRNTVWLLTNGKYIFSLVVLMVVLLQFRSNWYKQQDQHQAYSFADYISILKILRWEQCDFQGILFSLSCFIAFMILLPLLVMIWLCVLCYRQYIYFIIRVSWECYYTNYLLNVIIFIPISILVFDRKNTASDFVASWKAQMPFGHLKTILPKA